MSSYTVPHYKYTHCGGCGFAQEYLDHLEAQTTLSTAGVRDGGSVAQRHTRQKCARFLKLFSFSKLLVVVFRPVSVEEMVSVEDAASTRYGI